MFARKIITCVIFVHQLIYIFLKKKITSKGNKIVQLFRIIIASTALTRKLMWNKRKAFAVKSGP